MPLRWMSIAALILTVMGVSALAQYRARIWERYEPEMQDPVDDPPDVGRKGDFALGRLRYRSPLDRRRRGGYSRWGIDANKGDRLFIGLLRRLTTIDAEPIETIVDVDSDTVLDHPFLIAISVGDWELSPTQAARLKDFFDRGGFLFVDDFHNEGEWAGFMDGIQQMYPQPVIEEIGDDDPAFHVVFDLSQRIRVVGANVVHTTGIERGGIEPHWRAMRDSQGRMIVGISFNQDVGDGWEFADDPEYPERMSSAAIRLGVNYAVYAMTH